MREGKVFEAERNKLRRQLVRQGGPTGDGDFNCWCTIASLCLTVTDGNDRTPADVRKLQDERRLLECRNKYADWLQIKTSPNHAQRQREIQAERARRKADKEAMDRLGAAQAAKEKAVRQKKLDEQKQRCRKPEMRRVKPCSCAAALNEPLAPGGVCEA